MDFDPADTIAAVSSPPGFGFRGIVRLSGPHAIAVGLAGFEPEGGGAVHRTRARRTRGSYRLEGLRPPLPAALLTWPGTKSYTGQPSAEIHTVGSPPLLQHLLGHCLAHGARLAGAGEFTLRAFLSGRIDLTQAEAVLGVIDARSPAQLDAALGQLAGGLASPIAALRDRLLDVLAHLEANLDFLDEPDVDELGRMELAAELARGAEDVAGLAGRMRGRDRPGGTPRVVLVGPPNAGKSRLFNALVGEDRAIVSPVPGTTRDYLVAACDCDGLTVDLVDTAGEESTPDGGRVEALAQEQRAGQAEVADLLLVCEAADGGDAPPLPSPNQPSLRVRTKADLGIVGREGDAVATSAATGAGLDALRGAIARALRTSGDEADLATTTGARCREGLEGASAALGSAAEAIALGLGDELVSVDLRQAIDELGKVIGVAVGDEVLDRIFRRFCIGK